MRIRPVVDAPAGLPPRFVIEAEGRAEVVLLREFCNHLAIHKPAAERPSLTLGNYGGNPGEGVWSMLLMFQDQPADYADTAKNAVGKLVALASAPPEQLARAPAHLAAAGAITQARAEFAAELQRDLGAENQFRQAVDAEKARLYRRASRPTWWRRVAAIFRSK